MLHFSVPSISNTLLIVKFWQLKNEISMKKKSCFYNIPSLLSCSECNVSSLQESAIDKSRINLLVIADVFIFAATEEWHSDNSPMYFLFWILNFVSLCLELKRPWAPTEWDTRCCCLENHPKAGNWPVSFPNQANPKHPSPFSCTSHFSVSSWLC